MPTSPAARFMEQVRDELVIMKILDEYQGDEVRTRCIYVVMSRMVLLAKEYQTVRDVMSTKDITICNALFPVLRQKVEAFYAQTGDERFGDLLALWQA